MRIRRALGAWALISCIPLAILWLMFFFRSVAYLTGVSMYFGALAAWSVLGSETPVEHEELDD